VICAEDENAGGFQEPFLFDNSYSKGRLLLYFIYINESNVEARE
jgi:hypothetical protein